MSKNCVLIGGLLEVFCGELTRRKDLVLRGGERPTWAGLSQTCEWNHLDGLVPPLSDCTNKMPHRKPVKLTFCWAPAHPQDWDNKMAFCFQPLSFGRWFVRQQKITETSTFNLLRSGPALLEFQSINPQIQELKRERVRRRDRRTDRKARCTVVAGGEVEAKRPPRGVRGALYLQMSKFKF